MKTPFAYRLKAARIQMGVTQEQLARALGISKQAVSQYEHGKKHPESTTLLAIARYFNKPAGHFLQPVTTILKEVAFRKRAALQGKKLQMVKTTILDRLEPYLELERLLGIDPDFVNPLAAVVINDLEVAESAAIQLLQHWELGFNPIPNMLEMLEDKGVKIVEVVVDPQFDGLSTLLDGRIPVIVLNRHFDTLRKRFTVMHELGHLLLNFPESVSEAFREKACNRFAGAMLLPAKILRTELGARRSKVSWSELIPIKEYYGISLAAIVYRAGELGIFPDALVNRFWKWRNEDLSHKLETGLGHYPGEERSLRFEQLLSKALAEELLSYSKAAQMAGEDLSAFKEKHALI